MRGWWGGQREAYMGEPEAEGRRRVAPRHPAARQLRPGPQAAAGNRLRETGCGPRRPIRYADGGGRARYRGYATLRRVILLAVFAVRSERATPYPLVGGGGGYRASKTGSTTVVAPCPNIPPRWPCP